MKRTIIVFLTLICFATSLHAQTFTDISGRVTIESSGYGLQDATVTAFTGTTDCGWTSSQAITSPFGYYTVSVNTECVNISVVVSHKSYANFSPNARIYLFTTPTTQPINNADFVASP